MIKNIFFLMLIPLVAMAQNYAGAALGSAIFKMICWSLVIFLHLLWIYILVKSRLKKQQLSKNKIILIAVIISTTLGLDYSSQMTGTILSKYADRTDMQLLAIDEQKYFMMEVLSPHGCQGDLFFVDKKNDLKILLESNYSLFSFDEFDLAMVDNSLQVIPDDFFEYFLISRDGKSFHKTIFSDEFYTTENHQPRKILMAVVQDHNFWLVTRGGSQTEVFELDKNNFLKKSSKSVNQKILNLVVSPTKLKCGKQLNNIFISKLISFLKN